MPADSKICLGEPLELWKFTDPSFIDEVVETVAITEYKCLIDNLSVAISADQWFFSHLYFSLIFI